MEQSPITPNPIVPPTPVSPTNQPIFNEGLVNAMTEKKNLKHKKNTNKIMLSFAIGGTVLGLFLIVFFIPQLSQYLKVDSQLDLVQQQVDSINQEIVELTEQRDESRQIYEENFKEEKAILDKVLPVGTNKLDLIRLIEDYAAFLANTYGNFEFNSINLNEPIDQGQYVVLPFQTTIKASQANFERLLGLINLSGNISTEIPDHIRLMDISQISVRQMGTDDLGRSLGVEVSLRMNAYSRKPVL